MTSDFQASEPSESIFVQRLMAEIPVPESQSKSLLERFPSSVQASNSRTRSLRNHMEYKGYSAQFTFEEKQELFQGKVSNIYDLVTFQGKSLETLQYYFRDAVNEYIAWCEKLGNVPEKPSVSSTPTHKSLHVNKNAF